METVILAVIAVILFGCMVILYNIHMLLVNYTKPVPQKREEPKKEGYNPSFAAVDMTPEMRAYYEYLSKEG